MALPQNGQVIGGQATITQTSPGTLTIDQSSNNAAINWQSFSIGKTETTRFVQPGSSAVAINRVTGADPSVIEGHLDANGEVILVNPNGMLFTKTAAVNVGGLVASTSGISTANAIASKTVFDQGSASGAQIVNQGTITAAQGGLVALVSPTVVNSGVINARLAPVALASGDKWALDLYGDNLVKFALNDAVTGKVVNSGKINAIGTQDHIVQITANVAADVVSNVIDMSGVIVANSYENRGGSIYLEANQGTITVSGKATAEDNGGVVINDTAGRIGVSGNVDAASISVKGEDVGISGNLQADSRGGGDIYVDGDTVTLNGATLGTAGETFAGTIAIDGQTIALKNAHVNATNGGHSGTVDIGNKETQKIGIDAGSVISVLGSNGGDVNIYSAGSLNFAGKIDARGTINNGGTVITTANMFDIDGGTVDVAGGSNGTPGKWLIRVID